MKFEKTNRHAKASEKSQHTATTESFEIIREGRKTEGSGKKAEEIITN